MRPVFQIISSHFIGRCITLSISSLFFMSGNAQSHQRVLFLGNSYTHGNNMPALLRQLARSAGDSVYTEMYAPGGYTLKGHSTNQQSLAKIRSGNWNFLVLQEQSQLPSLPDPVFLTESLPYAGYLDSVARSHNACIRTVFFQTWGRKNGDMQNCASWPPVCTYRGMDSLLALRYRQMAEDNDAYISPVGAVWRFLREHHPGLDLYLPDNSHPNLSGSYAAACSFYTVMFRKDPSLLSWNGGLADSIAGRIRQAVKEVLYDSLAKWQVGTFDAKSSFDFTDNGDGYVSLDNSSLNADSSFWYFGDGATSVVPAPFHQYVHSGSYEISLIASNCHSADTMKRVVPVCRKADLTCDPEPSFVVYPNPSDGIVYINAYPLQGLRMFNAAGQRMAAIAGPDGLRTKIDLRNLPRGVYYIRIPRGDKVISRKVIRL